MSQLLRPVESPPVRSARRHVPGPKGLPIIGSLPEFRRDPLRLMGRVVRECGDVAKINLAQPVYFVNHPDGVKHVLQDNHGNYKKNYFYDRLRPIMGNGLFTSSGDFWLRQRRLAQPAFHRQTLSAFADLIVRHTAKMLERWELYARDGRVFDVHAELSQLTLVVVGDALFSIDLAAGAAHVGQALTDAIAVTGDRFQELAPLPLGIPTPNNRRLVRAIRILDDVVGNIVAQRRSAGDAKRDLLGLFMSARDAESGDGMSDAQLRDEVMTMVLAGHETTANALAFTFHLLSRHPEICRRLSAEVRSALGDDPPTFERLASLRYASQVTDEAMRLFPPLWAIGRKAVDDDEIGGYAIPRGANIILVQYTTHRHRDFWENPEGFDPDRFSTEASAGRHRYAFFPFGGGPRMCIGSHFAVMEMQIVVSMAVQRFRLDMAPHCPVDLDPAVVLRPARGIMVTARRL
jgi:cytochrome P450